MIKSVFLAVVAAASAAPEADPQVLAALPYAAAPVAVGYHGFGYYGKREAEADPAVIAGRTTVLSAPTPLIHNPPVRPVVHHPVVAAPAVAAVGYAGYHGLGYGLPLAHAVVKRDAEADPAVIAAPAVAAVGYAGLGYHGLGYGLPLAHAVVKREADPQVLLAGHAALPYAAAPVVAPATFASVGAVAHAPVVKAVVESPAEVSHEVAAHHVPLAVGYAGYHGYPFYG